MSKLHAHFQIETTRYVTQEDLDGKFKTHFKGYNVGDAYQAESMQGFDPEDKEDRQLLHDCLDEYLDYLVKVKKHALEQGLDKIQEHEDNHFEVMGYLDSH